MKIKLDNQLKTTIEKYKKNHSYAKTIIYYGRYNITLLGHRYDIHFAN